MTEAQSVLKKALAGDALEAGDLTALLETEDPSDLFQAARALRERVFGNRVFVYGFVYFSTFCRNNCAFCYYRRGHALPRYRKDPAEVAAIAKNLAREGVCLVDLTMGEDAEYLRNNCEQLADLVRQVKRETGLPVMVSPGLAPAPAIDALANAGADWYALYQETHNRALFEKLRPGQDWAARMEAKRYARACGMLVEEGILTGVGETTEDAAQSILEMGKIPAAQMRVMSLNPQPGTPMEGVPTPDRGRELRIIAAMRLANPRALIPASLDVDGMAGLAVRLEAGANVITSIIPPASGLTGVAQTGAELERQGRTVAETTEILHKLGLERAHAQEYRNFIENVR